MQTPPRWHQESGAQRAHAFTVPSSSLVLRDTAIKGLIQTTNSVKHTQFKQTLSRMNSVIVIFFNTIEKANEVVQRGIIIDGVLTPVLPLSLPSKRVTISNVPPFISDVVLTQALSRYGKLVSSIKKIPIGRVSPLLKHVVSFRRSVYMVVNNDADLDLLLNFRVDDFDYVVSSQRIRSNASAAVISAIWFELVLANKWKKTIVQLTWKVQLTVLCKTAGVTGEAGEAKAESAVARASDPDGAQSAGTAMDALVSVEEEIESEKKC